MAKNVTIKDWKLEERPREKMRSHGARSLDLSELLAILIHSGNHKETAVDVSKRLLAKAGNSLNNLSSLSFKDLVGIKGIGQAKAVSIMATFELASRLAAETPQIKPQIISSSSVVRLIAPLIKNLPNEECWVLYLNRANKLIAKENVSIGGVSSTIFDTRMIIKKAVEYLASSIVVVHNHPSGNPYPGEQDRIQTRLLKDAAALLDIALLDHVIIAGDKHYSFSDESIV